MALTDEIPVYQNTTWRGSFALVLVAVFAAFALPLYEIASLWFTKADYSYGFLVPIFSGWWLWKRKDKFPRIRRWPKSEGLPFVLFGSVFLALGTLNYAKEMMQGMGFALALTGTIMMFCGGWRGLKWSWPAMIFLLFMCPLPNRIENTLAWQLRRFAAEVSNVVLQTIGFSSYITGNGTVITVGSERLDVEHACSGLGMLLAFGALCAAAAMTIKRPPSDKFLILLSALPIAIIANVVRITMTGIVYAFGWHWLGGVIVHDLAGWLMMPIALALIWLELRMIDWLFVTPIRIRKEDFIRQQFITAQQDAPLVLGKPALKRAADASPTQSGSNAIPMPSGRPVAPDAIPMPAGAPPASESP